MNSTILFNEKIRINSSTKGVNGSLYEYYDQAKRLGAERAKI
ncbi:MAG TPA: hypothetical protein VD770_01690 [Coxiellaceae bacterium]|nr:hypothetical protein [Coxiellaceae bacterium]